MVSSGASDDNSNLIRSTLEWIANAGINGLGVLPSAEEVAADHLSKVASVEDAIQLLRGELRMLLVQVLLLD